MGLKGLVRPLFTSFIAKSLSSIQKNIIPANKAPNGAIIIETKSIQAPTMPWIKMAIIIPIIFMSAAALNLLNLNFSS